MEERTSKVAAFIQSHYTEIISISQLADACGENYNTLRRVFRNDFGKTLKQYYDEVRVNNARKLLLMTNLKCYAIARETGFVDEVIFEKVFKRVTGITPNEYRRVKWVIKKGNHF